MTKKLSRVLVDNNKLNSEINLLESTSRTLSSGSVKYLPYLLLFATGHFDFRCWTRLKARGEGQKENEELKTGFYD